MLKKFPYPLWSIPLPPLVLAWAALGYVWRLIRGDVDGLW